MSSPPPLLKNWDSLGKEALLDYQGRALHRYLRDCVFPFSKHYGGVARARNLSANDFKSVRDLWKLPFLAKTDLLATADNPLRARDFILQPDAAVLSKRPRTILRALRHGRARVKDELEREWRPTFLTSTTGRSSEPIAFLYTQRDVDVMGVAAGRIVEFNPFTPDVRFINMFPHAPHLAYWMFYESARAKNIFCLGTGGGKCMGTEGNLSLMKKLNPAVVAGMPTFIYHVLHEAVEQGLQLDGIKIVFLGGEKVAEGTRRKLYDLAAKLGSPEAVVVSTYAFTEAKMAWAECPAPVSEGPTGYHLYPDLGIIEIIDPETGEVQPEGVGGEIVWTPLVARGSVVLRYRTGDISEHGLSYEPCPHCGRRCGRLLGKISRVSDMRAMRFQKVKGTIVDFNELELILDDVPGLGSWQVELRKRNNDPSETDQLIVHAARTPEATDDGVVTAIRVRFQRSLELTPNAVVFHTPEEIRTLQQVGVAMKELKVVDNRNLAAPTAVPPPAPPCAPVPNKLNEELAYERTDLHR